MVNGEKRKSLAIHRNALSVPKQMAGARLATPLQTHGLNTEAGLTEDAPSPLRSCRGHLPHSDMYFVVHFPCVYRLLEGVYRGHQSFSTPPTATQCIMFLLGGKWCPLPTSHLKKVYCGSTSLDTLRNLPISYSQHCSLRARSEELPYERKKACGCKTTTQEAQAVIVFAASRT